MRSEEEMITLLKEVAENDPRIRAAYLEGSRVNPTVKKDIFQDYDVEFIVNETKSFQEDKNWINQFGERLYMQCPEDSVYGSSDKENSYGWLMQFADGNRIDLHVCTLEYAKKSMELYQILVDKDNILPKQEAATDELYWVKRPTGEQFSCTCNEFWWCLNNVAKGLWRDEIPYVMDMLDFCIRPMLKRLLEWKIGVQTEFKVSPGKSGKYIKKYLSKEEYQEFLATYAIPETKQIWEATFCMCDLFERTAKEVSKALEIDYNQQEARNSRKYLDDIRRLPENAKEIY